jgi:lysozyme
MNEYQDWLDFCLPLTKQWEGCSLTAYPDPATGDEPWTIGYGSTGPGIFPGLIWTQDQAYADLIHRLTYEFAPGVQKSVTVELSAQQMAACVDLAYNIGVTAFSGSTLVSLLNQGYPRGAADQFLVWDKSNGQVMQGLLNRRKAERALFLEGTT